MKILDLDTPEGLIAHLRTLSDEALQAISQRPLCALNATLILGAGMILDARELGLQ